MVPAICHLDFRGCRIVLDIHWSHDFPLDLGMQFSAVRRFANPFDTWQLVINTGTTIVTFLMVFLIQNTQNRDAKAIHLKLDELIRAHSGARNRLVDLQNCTDEELEHLRKEFERIRERATGKPHVHADREVAAVEVEQQNRVSAS